MKDYLKTIKKFNDDDWQKIVNELKLDYDFSGAANITFQNVYTKVYEGGVFIGIYSIYKFNKDDKGESKCKTFFFDEFNCYSVVGKERIKLDRETKDYVKFLENKFGRRYKLKRESKINDKIKNNEREMAIQ